MIASNSRKSYSKGSSDWSVRHAEYLAIPLVLAIVVSAVILADGLVSNVAAGPWLAMTVTDAIGIDGLSGLLARVKKEKKTKCPEGYRVLDKPNQYGALCEPSEGLPKTTTPAEPAACKFGMIGTPPNDCHCPEGTEFAGYKGCIKTKRKCIIIPPTTAVLEKCAGASVEQLADGNILYCCPQ